MAIIEGTLVLQQGINAQQTACCHLLSDWQRVGGDNYLFFQDDVDGNGYITDPDSEITHASRQVFGRDNRMGLLLGARMVYGGGGLTGDPVIKVFGRTRHASGDLGEWPILKNRLGEKSVTLQTAPYDCEVVAISNDTFATTADLGASYFDTRGCNEFLVGVEVGAEFVSNPENCDLYVKFIERL